ncbi:uncharacterized protein LOC119547020 [Drosophila subpulchrella]|uniref:uncharacterized protein LOC119547020 n=1 Tax=Drosophila subpulchrella TaxID=1486046 RepID=UPI0018A1580F|nr:uncharacterized protein LOC119547020 [Drosophila subpulchrella]
MAAIYSSNMFQCGGTLIHKRFVLTAAHCVIGRQNLLVYLGAYNISQPTAQYNVVHVEVHSSYGLYVNDIALLKLSSSVVYNESIYPICIVLDKEIKNQVENTWQFKTFGWGRKRDGQTSDILQTVTLNNLYRSECERIFGVQITFNRICAGSTTGDTCGGDSGGPLTTEHNFRQTQIGIVSYGLQYCNGIGVYTCVTSYVDWIEGTIKRLDYADDDNSQGLRNYENIWLYRDCGGNDIKDHLHAFIAGLIFKTQGVLITDQFVLTHVTGLPCIRIFITVTVKHGSRVIGEYEVDSIFKHPEYSFHSNDIALLKLSRRVNYPYGVKPICLLARENLLVSLVMDIAPDFIDPFDCKLRTGNSIQPTQFCKQFETDNIDTAGLIVGKNVHYLSRNWLVLHGIVSYSSNGLYVFENVVKHMYWIASTVNEN